MQTSGGIDVRGPDAPQGIAIPGVPAGLGTNLDEAGAVVTVRAHVRAGRVVRAHRRVIRKSNSNRKGRKP